MIVRIRIYLQSYIMMWRHVSGPLLVGGDFMSRMHQYAKPAPLALPPTEFAPENSITIIAKGDISTPSMAAAMVASVIATYLALCRQFHLGYRR